MTESIVGEFMDYDRSCKEDSQPSYPTVGDGYVQLNELPKEARSARLFQEADIYVPLNALTANEMKVYLESLYS